MKKILALLVCFGMIAGMCIGAVQMIVSLM